MRQLKQDPFARRPMPTTVRGRSGIGGVGGLGFLAASAALLLLSAIDHSLVRKARAALIEVAAPLARAAAVPLQPVRRLLAELVRRRSQAEEIARLAEENARLKSWEWRARELEQRIAALSVIAKVAPEQAMRFLTARVIALSSGAFARSLMIEAGMEQGVRKGQPVLDAGGLVGRVVEAGRTTSQVLLITDPQSRVPVEVGQARTRAILTGDHDSLPHLEFVPRGVGIVAGEAIATSGTGGGFPRGLRVGVTTLTADGLRVEVAGRLDVVDYVSVLLIDPSIVETGEHTVTSSPTDARQRAKDPRKKQPAGEGRP